MGCWRRYPLFDGNRNPRCLQKLCWFSPPFHFLLSWSSQWFKLLWKCKLLLDQQSIKNAPSFWRKSLQSLTRVQNHPHSTTKSLNSSLAALSPEPPSAWSWKWLRPDRERNLWLKVVFFFYHVWLCFVLSLKIPHLHDDDADHHHDDDDDDHRSWIQQQSRRPQWGSRQLQLHWIVCFLDFRSWKNLSQPPLSSHSGNIRRLGNRRQGKRQDHWFENIFIFFITITISGLMQWWFGPNSDMSRWKVTMASVWFIHQYINTLIFSLVWPIIY